MAPAQVRLAACRRSHTSGANGDGIGRHDAGYRSETECDARYDRWRTEPAPPGRLARSACGAGRSAQARPLRDRKRVHPPPVGRWRREFAATPAIAPPADANGLTRAVGIGTDQLIAGATPLLW